MEKITRHYVDLKDRGLMNDFKCFYHVLSINDEYAIAQWGVPGLLHADLLTAMIGTGITPADVKSVGFTEHYQYSFTGTHKRDFKTTAVYGVMCTLDQYYSLDVNLRMKSQHFKELEFGNEEIPLEDKYLILVKFSS